MSLPPDPDLEPVAAARAAMAALDAAATPAGPRRPLVRRADPDRWQTVVPLSMPLLVDEERLDSLTLRCLTGQELVEVLMAPEDGASLNIRVRAAMAGVHWLVLAEMAATDAERVAAAARPFLPPSLVEAEDDLRDALADENYRAG
jgi:hypothetical protein